MDPSVLLSKVTPGFPFPGISYPAVTKPPRSAESSNEKRSFDAFLNLAVTLMDPLILGNVTNTQVYKYFQELDFDTDKTIILNAKALQNAKKAELKVLFELIYNQGCKTLRHSECTLPEARFDKLLGTFEKALNLIPRDWSLKWKAKSILCLKPWGPKLTPSDPKYDIYTCLNCVCHTTEIPALVLHNDMCNWRDNHCFDRNCLPCLELSHRYITNLV